MNACLFHLFTHEKGNEIKLEAVLTKPAKFFHINIKTYWDWYFNQVEMKDMQCKKMLKEKKFQSGRLQTYRITIKLKFNLKNVKKEIPNNIFNTI